MPYFKWTGVDSVGKTKKGYLLAHSPQELDDRLFRKGIALISCKKRYIVMASRIINIQQKGALFAHMAQLLQAGVLLPKALELVAAQSTNLLLHDIVLRVSKDVYDGTSFIVALAQYKKISDPFVMTVLTAGHEAGDLAQAFEHCAFYYKKRSAFEKTIYASLAMPIVTILFFVVASVFIFTAIIPRFADMFASLQHDLPIITQRMIYVSSCMRSRFMLSIFLCAMTCAYCVYYWFRKKRKKWLDTCIAAMPFFGKLIRYYHLQQILRALSLLTYGGATITKSFALVVKLESNYCIQERLKRMEYAISSGVLMSDAMAESGMFFSDIIAIIHIGQESGSVGQSFEYAADIYQNKIDEMLRKMTIFIQPTIVIVLGFLITLLIFAVYLPIIELSRVI